MGRETASPTAQGGHLNSAALTAPRGDTTAQPPTYKSQSTKQSHGPSSVPTEQPRA